MRTTSPTEFNGTEGELEALTSDLIQLEGDHRSGLQRALAECGEQVRHACATATSLWHRDATRRMFLAGGAATVGGVVLAACGDNGTSSAASSATGSLADAQLIKLAASVEILAVNTYKAAIAAVGAGKFGSVPPAVVKFAGTAMQQHTDHQAAWNALLVGAGLPAQTDPDPKLNSLVQPKLAAVSDIASLAALALLLETVAVETYTAGAPAITDSGARQLALQIAPVEAQHVAILNFVIGKYPVPDSQIKLDQAAPVSDLG